MLKAKGRPCRPKEAFELAAWALFAVAMTLIVFFESHMRIRYMAPAIPGLAILSVSGLNKLTTRVAGRDARSGGHFFIFLPFAAAVIMLGMNTAYTLNQFKLVMPFSYQSGRLTRDQYIEKFRPEHTVIQHANRHLPADAVILSLFIGRRGYYSERAMRYDVHEFAAAVHAADSVTGLRQQLVSRGLTHLIVRYDLFSDWCNRSLDEDGKLIVFSLLKSPDMLLLAKNGHGLYRLE